MAHKKGQGSTQNNRDSIGRRLGVKKTEKRKKNKPNKKGKGKKINEET